MDFSALENDILSFWFGPEPHRKREVWFQRDGAFDAEIARRFGAVYDAAVAGELDGMAGSPGGCLALILVLDQFPRNLFRDDPRAFAGDEKARALSRRAVANGFDGALSDLQRQFLYMPFQHSEDLDDQRRSVALFAPMDAESRRYAQRHLEIIERFGRFPHRNAALGRETTAAEAAFLQEPDSSF